MSTSPLGKGQSRGNLETEDLGEGRKTAEKTAQPMPASATADSKVRLWQPSKPAQPAKAWVAASTTHLQPNTKVNYDDYEHSEPMLTAVSPRVSEKETTASSDAEEKVQEKGQVKEAKASTSSTPSPATSSVSSTSASKPGTGKPPSTSATPSVSTSTSTSTAATASPASSGTHRSLAASALTPKIQAIVAAGMQSEGKLSAESLGELLVAVESNCGQAPMTEASIKDILRPGLRITGYQVSGVPSIEINVIQKFSDPFMNAILDTPEYDRLLKTMVREFDAVAGPVNSLSENKKSHQYVRDPDVSALMLPVITPFLDKFCGKERTYATSTMPGELKRLLMTIDAGIIRWFKKSGTGVPRDLFAARRNAIANYLSTRSIMPIWDNKLRAMFPDQPGRYNKLTGFLNSTISLMLDDFIKDLMLAQPNQSSEEKSYVEVLAGRKALKSKPSMPRLQLSSQSVFGTEKSLKAMGTSTPRSVSSPRTATSPTSAERKAAEKAEKKAAMERKLERAKLADQIAKQADLSKLDHKFYQYLKEIIINTSVRGFDNFKKDPIRSCIKHADNYYNMPENLKIARTTVPQTVRANLEKIHDDFLPEASDEDSSEENAVLDKAMTAALSQGTGNPLNLALPPNSFEYGQAQSSEPSSVQENEKQPATEPRDSIEADTQRSAERSSDQ